MIYEDDILNQLSLLLFSSKIDQMQNNIKKKHVQCLNDLYIFLKCTHTKDSINRRKSSLFACIFFQVFISWEPWFIYTYSIKS